MSRSSWSSRLTWRPASFLWLPVLRESCSCICPERKLFPASVLKPAVLCSCPETGCSLQLSSSRLFPTPVLKPAVPYTCPQADCSLQLSSSRLSPRGWLHCRPSHRPSATRDGLISGGRLVILGSLRLFWRPRGTAVAIQHTVIMGPQCVCSPIMMDTAIKSSHAMVSCDVQRIDGAVVSRAPAAIVRLVHVIGACRYCQVTPRHRRLPLLSGHSTSSAPAAIVRSLYVISSCRVRYVIGVLPWHHIQTGLTKETLIFHSKWGPFLMPIMHYNRILQWERGGGERARCSISFPSTK